MMYKGGNSKVKLNRYLCRGNNKWWVDEMTYKGEKKMRAYFRFVFSGMFEGGRQSFFSFFFIFNSFPSLAVICRNRFETIGLLLIRALININDNDQLIYFKDSFRDGQIQWDSTPLMAGVSFFFFYYFISTFLLNRDIYTFSEGNLTVAIIHDFYAFRKRSFLSLE